MVPGQPNRELYSDDRIPALIKHHLLGKYLFELAMRVGQGGWESLFFLDGFAGPWGSSPSCDDSSFGIATNTLATAQRILNDRWGKTLALHGFLIERDRKAFPKLAEFAAKHHRKPVNLTAREGEFEDYIDEIKDYISRLGSSSFRFLLLDPKGWKGLAMAQVSKIAKARSSEVLVNVMVRHLKRFLAEENRAESYFEFFGRNDVRDIVLAASKENKADALVREYCKSLKSLCKFNYVSSCMILNEDKSEARYYMVYGTNNVKGIEVFKDAETDAAKLQHEVVTDLKKRRREGRHGGSELDLFEESTFVQRKRTEYFRKAFLHAKMHLEEHRKVLYRDLFCEAGAFPLVTKAMVHQIVREIPGIRFELESDGKPSKRGPRNDRDDYCILD